MGKFGLLTMERDGVERMKFHDTAGILGLRTDGVWSEMRSSLILVSVMTCPGWCDHKIPMSGAKGSWARDDIIGEQVRSC